MGLGHLGVPWGWVSWGVRRWGCGLGLDGVLVTLGCCFSGGGMRRCWGCLCRRTYVASLAAALFGLVRGGVWGSGGALPPGWGTAGPGGLGSWLCAAGSMGWCMRLGPALVWGSSMPSCLRRGGGVQYRRVNGLYPGCLLSYVVWELTGWWGGVVFLCCGSGGPPRAAMGPGLDGPGPPALGRFGVTGGPMGGSAGELAPEGGVFCPLWCFPPHPKASLLPLHHTNT